MPDSLCVIAKLLQLIKVLLLFTYPPSHHLHVTQPLFCLPPTGSTGAFNSCPAHPSSTSSLFAFLNDCCAIDTSFAKTPSHHLNACQGQANMADTHNGTVKDAVSNKASNAYSYAQRSLDRVVPPSSRQQAWDTGSAYASARPILFVSATAGLAVFTALKLIASFRSPSASHSCSSHFCHC